MSQWLLEDVSPGLGQCGDVTERQLGNGRRTTPYTELGRRTPVSPEARQVQRGFDRPRGL